MSQWAMMDFECPEHGRFESLELRAAAPDAVPCPHVSTYVRHAPTEEWRPVPCGQMSLWRIAAPMVRKLTIAVQAVTTAKSDERPTGMLDTRKLGLEGHSMREWNAVHDRADKDRRHKWLKENF